MDGGADRALRPGEWLKWLALAGILAWGAWLRLRLPQTPLADADTWGYLHPAISKLLGDGFIHTFGRNFVYPGWLYLLLRVTGDFRAIACAQHLLGLGAGLALWAIWLRWRQWLRHPRLPGCVAACMGLAMVAAYLGSESVIHFEQQIRPESIFPFFAILTFWLSLEFLRAWFVSGRHLLGAGLAAATIFDAALVYQIKPSFGLAAGVAGLPWLAAWFAAGLTWRRRLLLAGAAAVGAGLSYLLLIAPERALAQEDPMSGLFLPETLLTIHADIIRDQMGKDLQAGNPTRYTDKWLTTLYNRLSVEIANSRQFGRSYPSLGLDPDYLLYDQRSFCHFLGEEMSAPRLSRLAFYFYFRAWRQQPGAMASKVARQLAIFYDSPCPGFERHVAMHLDADWSRSAEAYSVPDRHAELARLPAAQRSMEQCRLLSQRSIVLRQPALVTTLDLFGRGVYLYLLGLSLAGLPFLALGRAGPDRRDLLVAGTLIWLLAALNFGACLTVAIVHSFEISRYSVNQLVLILPSVWLGLAWCCEAVLWAIE